MILIRFRRRILMRGTIMTMMIGIEEWRCRLGLGSVILKSYCRSQRGRASRPSPAGWTTKTAAHWQ